MNPARFLSRDIFRTLSARMGLPMLLSPDPIPEWEWDLAGQAILPLIAGKLVEEGEIPSLANATLIARAAADAIRRHAGASASPG